jgi:hypothetical protein
MLSALKNHPFAVEAFFDESIVLTFAFPKEQLQTLIPEALSLDTYKNEWAFIAVAVVKTRDLRPKGFPKLLGNDFVLIGYRVFVNYINSKGKRFRGLYILKSETNKTVMQIMGNIFTHYSYTTTDIQVMQKDTLLNINSRQSDLSIVLETGHEDVSLPRFSPFADWKEARRFAGPLPFTFTYNARRQEMLIVEGVREDWIPKPIEVVNQHIPFLKDIGLGDGILANAFMVNSIPYYWKKGKIEKWNN